MILGNAKRISGREGRKIAFFVGKLVPWSAQRRFDQVPIADAISSAKQRELLGMNIENDIYVEPFRLAHSASAL